MLKALVSENLKALAEIFPKPLYAVGGWVRDGLVGRDSKDIDLASACLPEEVTAFLQGSGFNVKPESAKLMTLKIIKEGESYEYTAFRKDTYVKGHTPLFVEPTDDLEVDAKRRDFRANAVYYHIAADETVDPLNGIADIKNKVLNAAAEPKKVFGEDGLRLMRLARFAGELGFTVGAQTLAAAKIHANLIKDIAPERIRDELDKILTADTKNGIMFGHIAALEILDEIGVLEIILPELTAGKGLVQRADYHKYDVFGHIMQTVKFAPEKIRLAALLHDIGKPYCFLRTGSYRNHDVQGERIAREIMERLRYSTKITEHTAKLVKNHMYDLKAEAKPATLRRFILEQREIIDDLLLLKAADSAGSGMNYKQPSGQRLGEEYEKMKAAGVPFSLKELKVRGDDAAHLPPETRSRALNALLVECAVSGIKTKEEQKDFLRKYKI